MEFEWGPCHPHPRDHSHEQVIRPLFLAADPSPGAADPGPGGPHTTRTFCLESLLQ